MSASNLLNVIYSDRKTDPLYLSVYWRNFDDENHFSGNY